MDHYLKNREKVQRLRQEADAKVSAAVVDMVNTGTQIECAAATMHADTERAVGVMNKAPAIIHDIHTQFEKATELRGKDIAFLFGAAALQTARWALLPGLDLDFSKVPQAQRMSAQQGAKIETVGIRDELKKHGIKTSEMRNHEFIQNYTWDKLLIAPVPYDAMHGSKDIHIPGILEVGKELNSYNHHSATWGHDPVFGWIIGPLNITARMITFRDFRTYHVLQMGDTFNQEIAGLTNPVTMVAKAINSWAEDGMRLGASVLKQKLHLQSDKYTKTGLPIPFLDGQTAQRLLMKGWNSNEVERMFTKAARNIGVISSQYCLAMIIDQFVRALHLLCYDESIDGAIGAYTYRSQKIICYSCAMAELANGIYVASTLDISKLDIGGYLHLAKELMTNAKLRNQLKAEFLEKELHRRIYGNEYYWEGI